MSASTPPSRAERVLAVLGESADAEEHARALTKLAQRRAQGYGPAELPVLAQILERLAPRLGPAYAEPLAAVLQPLQLLQGSAVDGAAARALCDALGSVLGVVYQQAAEQAWAAAVAEGVLLAVAGSVDVAAVSVADTRLASALAATLATPALDRVAGVALSVLEHVVQREPGALAPLLLADDALPLLLGRADTAAVGEATLVVHLALLLLEQAPEAELELGVDQARQLLASLGRCFTAHFNAAPELRNDIVLLLLQVEGVVGALFPDELVATLLVALCAADLRPPALRARGFKLGTAHPDFELHKLLVLLVQRLAQRPEHREAVGGSHFLKLLFHYLTASARGWTAPQFEELQLQALATLAQVAPLFARELGTLRGATQLLKMLANVAATPAASGDARNALMRSSSSLGNSLFNTGNSFATTDPAARAARVHRPALSLCLSAVVALLDLPGAAQAQELADQDLLSHLHTCLDKELPHALDRVETQVRTLALMALERLCRLVPRQAELFGEEGLKVVLAYTRDVPAQPDPGYQHMLVAAVNALW